MTIRALPILSLAVALLPATAFAQETVYGFGLQPTASPPAASISSAMPPALPPAPIPVATPIPSATRPTIPPATTPTPTARVEIAPPPVRAPAPSVLRAYAPRVDRPAPAPRILTASTHASATTATLPAILDAAQREGYRAVFAAIRSGDWSSAAARLDGMAAGPLHAVARAELYLAKGSPKVDGATLVALVASAPWLPQAAQLERLAAARGAGDLPILPPERDLVHMEGAPKRRAADTTRSDQAAATLARQVLPLIKDDRTTEAEALLIAAEPALSSDALIEWRQRIAWSYYLTGDDRDARRLATATAGASGPWAVQADWVAGLAAWRGQDCDAAGRAFSAVSARARDPEMTAAGLFWSARADVACGRPEQVQSKLRSASRLSETFYGMLASGALGTGVPAPEQRIAFAGQDRSVVAQRPNLAAAIALADIGEAALADTMIRHQARIGSAGEHEALLHLAAGLDLPATQIWLAQNGPSGVRMSASARYPAPGWTPQNGWRVDKALVLAHALQESQFRVTAISPAGARGLMQILPGTADLIARRRGESMDRSRLSDPAVNFEYGQSYLEQLSQSWMTGGLLPKVIAAYNAGPGSVQKWNERGRNLNDPLLFIESIPFVETRAYVAIVLRNYWMYQRQSGVAAASMKAMAQGLWPRFPGLSGATAIRIDGAGTTASIAGMTLGGTK